METVLVEAIPNVSEGRDPARIERFAEAFAGAPGVALLHVHPDADHHRTVYTAVGEPARLQEALLGLYERVLEQVDLRAHRGVHPRIGAVDVCPLVPLPAYGSDLAVCRQLAAALAEEVAERWRLPVYLYAESARDPGHRDLTAIRRGQFEGLADKMTEPAWRPDVGPARPHPSAGATVIGARGPLIAYNVVLDSDDLQVARAVARAVRASSGGLAGVKAMGVRLASRGRVQVSMNLERPDLTPLHVAVEAVRRAAAERGVAVLETELVGLMPLASALEAAAASLQLPGLPAARVLESAIAAALPSQSCDSDTVDGSMP